MKFSPRASARPKRYKLNRVGGTKVTILKVKRELRKHAFIATTKNNKQGVFIRTGEKNSEGKEKIKELYGPNTMQLFSVAEVQQVLEAKFYERIDIEFDRRMDYLSKKK